MTQPDQDEPTTTPQRQRTGWGQNPALILVAVALLAVLGLALSTLALRQKPFSAAGREAGDSGSPGQTVSDPKLAAQFDAPEPQPKQPSSTDVERSSGPTPTLTVPRSAGATQPANDTPEAAPRPQAGAREPTTVGTSSAVGASSNPGN